MGAPQKGKRRKRAKTWHRGAVERHKWEQLDLPEVGSGADPTSGVPIPLKARPRGQGRTWHGDAL